MHAVARLGAVIKRTLLQHISLLILVAVCLLVPCLAFAGTVVSVNNGDVAGLIAAIQTLNANGGGTINLSSSGTYSVSAPSDWWYGPNAFPAISSDITILGNGATITRVSGSPKFRFFYVSGGFSTLPVGELTLHNLTLHGGLAQGGNGGGGKGGAGGGAGMGGAIYNQGTLSLDSVTLSQNSAMGGSGGNGGDFSASGGGGIGGNGGTGGPFVLQNSAGGGGFKSNGQQECCLQGGYHPAYGGSFVSNEGGGLGSTSTYGGTGGSGGPQANGGGGGGYGPGQNGGNAQCGNTGGGPGAYGAGNGGAGGPVSCIYGGGPGGAFGGGGEGNGANLNGIGGAGGGGIGGGGGGGWNQSGSGGFGGGGGGGFQGGNGGFGGGGGGSYASSAGGPGFGGAGGGSSQGGGGAGFGGAIFNQLGTVVAQWSAFDLNAAAGGPGNAAHGFGGAIFNLNGTVTLDSVAYSANVATKSDGTADQGAVFYNLSHDGGNTAAGQTSVAALHLIGTTISTANGDLANNQVNGTAIVKTLATVTFSNLTQTYTGAALSPTVSTTPPGLTVTVTGVPRTNVGSYPVTATVNDPSYESSVTGTFVIQRAPATVTLGGLTQTYTGAALSPTVSTNPSGLSVSITGAPKTNAGTYSFTATVNDPNYQGSVTGTFLIQKATATVTLGGLTRTFTGRFMTPTVSTNPPGLKVVLTSGCPFNLCVLVGRFTVTGTVNDTNYKGSATGAFTITPVSTSAKLAIIPLYYQSGTVSASNPPPVSCSGSAVACQKYSDRVNFTVTISPGDLGGVDISDIPALNATTCNTAQGSVSAPCVNVAVGSQIYGPIALTVNSSGDLLGSLNNISIRQAPGAYTALVGLVSNVNSNYALNSRPTTSFSLKQEDASLTYTGLTDFTTSSGATTQSITVSYTVQDATATGTANPIYNPLAGDITKATLNLTLTGTSPSGPFTGNCGPVSVVALAGAVDATNGLPNKGTATCVFQNVPVNGTYTLTPSAASGSFYNPSAGDTSVTIVNGNDGAGGIRGSGYQTAAYLARSRPEKGKYTAAGLLVPAPGTLVEFSLDGAYDKQRVRGQASITIRSACLTGIEHYHAKAGDDGLCVYEIASDTIESLTLEPPDFEKFIATATIRDVTDRHREKVAEHVQLQLVMDVASADPDAAQNILGIQVTDTTHGLWFSNNWTGVDTAVSVTAPRIQGGTLALD